MPQCAVANCNNTHRKTKGGSVRYHRFPGDPTIRSHWLKACGRLVHNCATARVCSLHFRGSSYERDVQHELLGLPIRSRLKKGALPEINLPYTSLPEETPTVESKIAVLLAVGLVPNSQAIERASGGLPRDLNKMHVMEDVREGSDVPSAQPSSPGHAEQRPTIEEPNDNENGTEEIQSAQINGTDSKSNDDLKLEAKPESLQQAKDEVISLPDDAASNDSENSKRKIDGEESSSKRLRSLIEQNFVIRDKILNEYTDNSTSSTLQQIQTQMDQILSEIRVLNVLALDKEKEWNNIIHLKKIKEELLLRFQRRKQILTLTNDKTEWECVGSPEPPHENEEHSAESKQLKNLANPNSGLVIYSTSQSKTETGRKNSKNLPSTIIEINGHSGDLRQNRQRPVLDVQSIIADYRQRHPEAVPRRGRRIRSILNNQGSGSQVKQNLSSSGIENNSELGLLLTAVDNGKGAPKLGDGNETASFKDVLMQFAKLSQTERQDLLQSEMKQPPPYSEVTVHPVPAHTQPTTNSLLHGILTKTQSRSDNSKSTFSPTLARLLTAPERAAMSPHNNPLSVTDMLSNNKARNEITITPVGGQFDVVAKEKDEEEAEDSADRLVIDESEALDGRKCADTSSDGGDEVPQCQGCNQKPAQFVCAGCGNQWYCSRECQVVAWDEHSEVCSG
ncbi:uncharacterized protein LOC116181424 isoform X2 [Photinus pyralis]|uniref:uncharacterized protein LOC116181424 isoform X2 n=1 Tax=Photinus pyralis TaxID=7054 RepID=UPI0012677778|nr:uncharacterized protein LOC116181424 isoform X2 [Photinus pyralis]